MRIIKRGLLFGVLIVLSISLGGLASQKSKKLNEELRQKKPGFKNAVLVCDIIAAKDISGKIHAIDLPLSDKLSSKAASFVLEQLKNKGYSFKEKCLLRSTCLELADKEQLKLMRTEADYKKRADELELNSEPLIFEDAIGAGENGTKELREIAKSMVSETIVLQEDCIKAAQDLQADCLIVVLGRGVKVSKAKTINQIIASTILTLGMMSMWTQSGSRYDIMIIDGKTGESYKWSYNMGGGLNEKKLQKDLARVIKKIP